MDSPQAGLKALGERVQAALEAETQPNEQLRIARTRLLECIASGNRRQARASRTRRWSIGLAAAAALGLGATFALAALRTVDAPLSYETSLGERAVGDVLEAGASTPASVTFSEGTRVLLQRGTRARVLDTHKRGARVLLEGGALDVSVVHREHTRWLFEAGPFRVLIKGTEFELGWDPSRQQLSLQMKSGKVEVSGACLPAPRLLAHGAALRLSCESAPPQQPGDRAQAAATAETPVAPASAASTPEAETTRAQNRPERAAATVAPSFEESCERASKAELVSWSNRERLAGRSERARSALLALRKRFPGSGEAQTAAFTLGRMTFEQADYGAAARWFSSYLDEQPNGPLMGDAAGRLIEAHELQGNRSAARRAAQAYLRRFPDGPYAGIASRILAK
jgi:transmembrane sensor